MTIFLSISSYKDPLLINTLQSAYKNAKNKDSIIFAVVDQNDQKLEVDNFDFFPQLRYHFLPAEFARGCAWARSLAQSLYMGEDYFLQVDSHTIFEQDWDEYFISFYKKLSKKFYRPVISSYPRNFEIEDLETMKIKRHQEDDSNTHVMVIDEENVFKEGYFSMKKGLSIGDNEIKKGFLIAGGCLFSSGSIIEDIPYDPYLYFDGEEDSMAWRLFTNGYNIFHTPNTPIFHYYVDPSNIVTRPFHWDQTEETKRDTNWHDLKQRGRKRLNAIVENNLEGVYALGQAKNLDDYSLFSGLDIKNKQVLDPENVFNFNKLKDLKWNQDSEKTGIFG